MISSKTRKPPENYTDEQWQSDFQKLRNEIQPSALREMPTVPETIKEGQVYHGKTEYQCYCDFINDILMETWLHNNSAATKQYGASVESLRTRLNELYSSGELTEAQLREIAQEFNNVATSAKLAGVTGKTFGSTLVASFKSILKYVSVSTLIYQLINAFRSMYNNVLEINTAMVELKKVTKETDVAYDAFLDNAGKKAQKLGTTIKELVTSTADFARLGYSLEDSETLAEVANIYSVVGDDIENIDVATQSIVSTMTAFKVDVKDAMRIVDKFNEVSNNFAISSGGIGEALQRSASSLAAANNTLDQSIALITAANTVVQDPDAVGTAFKTIAMRIRAAKTELSKCVLLMSKVYFSVSP